MTKARLIVAFCVVSLGVLAMKLASAIASPVGRGGEVVLVSEAIAVSSARPWIGTKAQRDATRASRGFEVEAEVWLDVPATQSYYIVCIWSWLEDDRTWALHINRKGQPQISVSSDGVDRVKTAAPRRVAVGRWVKLRARYISGELLELFVNGVRRARTTDGVPERLYLGDAPLTIGAPGGVRERAFPGAIRNVRVRPTRPGT